MLVFFPNYAKHLWDFVLNHQRPFSLQFKDKKGAKANVKKLTASLFIACGCLVCRSQFTAVLSTVGWWGIGAGSCKSLYTSSTRYTAVRNRPVGVAAVHSCKRHKQKICLHEYPLHCDLSFRGPWAGFKFSLLTLPLQRTDKKIENWSGTGHPGKRFRKIWKASDVFPFSISIGIAVKY